MCSKCCNLHSSISTYKWPVIIAFCEFVRFFFSPFWVVVVHHRPKPKIGCSLIIMAIHCVQKRKLDFAMWASICVAVCDVRTYRQTFICFMLIVMNDALVKLQLLASFNVNRSLLRNKFRHHLKFLVCCWNCIAHGTASSALICLFLKVSSECDGLSFAWCVCTLRALIVHSYNGYNKFQITTSKWLVRFSWTRSSVPMDKTNSN